MSEFVEIGCVDDFRVGSVRAFDVGGRRIAVYRTTRGFFATDDTCPHRGGPLHEGDVLGDEIVCPWHFWSFDICSGRNCADESIGVTTHEVRVDEGKISVKLSEQEAENRW